MITKVKISGLKINMNPPPLSYINGSSQISALSTWDIETTTTSLPFFPMAAPLFSVAGKDLTMWPSGYEKNT
jgi:hypothetical protein